MAAHQAPLSLGFSRQEYWSWLPLPSPEEISSLSHSIVFLYFFALITEEGSLISLAILWEIASWEIDGETVETVSDFILGGSKITADVDCSHEIKRCLLL